MTTLRGRIRSTQTELESRIHRYISWGCTAAFLGMLAFKLISEGHA